MSESTTSPNGTAAPAPTSNVSEPSDSPLVRRVLTVAAIWIAAVALAALFWRPLVSGAGFIGGDINTYYFPLKAWYADRLRAGELALWNPLVGHGFPTVGESQTGVFYPFNLVFYRLLSLSAAYSANHLLHYVLAFGFTAHFARRLGFGLIESLLAAVVFVYGWFPVRSCLEWAIVTGAWLPLALLGTEGFIADGRRRWLLAIEVAIAMQLFAGHFNLAFITLVAIALYAPLRSLVLWRPLGDTCHRVAWIAASVLLAFGVASIQLLPSWELKARSQRGGAEFGEHQVGYGSIPPEYLGQIVLPSQFYPRVDDATFAKSHFGDKNTNKVEAHLYFALVPLVLAAVGVVSALARFGFGLGSSENRLVWLWLVIAAVGVILAVGVWTNWTSRLPGFSYFTGPGRYGLIVQLAVAMLGASGLSAVGGVVRWIRDRGAMVGWMVPAVAALVSVHAVERWTDWAGGLDVFCQSASGGSLPLRHAAVVASGVAGVMVTIAAWRRRVESALAGVLVALTVADFQLVSQRVGYAEMHANPPISLRANSVVGELLRQSSPHARVLARNQNAVSLVGVATVPVYLGIGPREYFDGPLRLPQEFQWNGPPTRELLEWLDWAGVTHLLALEPMAAEWPLDLIWAGYDPFLHGVFGRNPRELLFLYALHEPRGHAYWLRANDSAAVIAPQDRKTLELHPIDRVEFLANRVTLDVTLTEAAVVVLSDLAYPGWTVTVDRAPRESLSESALRAVRVEAGEHTIQWDYRPSNFWFSIVLSVTSLGVSVAVQLGVRGGRFGGK